MAFNENFQAHDQRPGATLIWNIEMLFQGAGAQAESGLFEESAIILYAAHTSMNGIKGGLAVNCASRVGIPNVYSSIYQLGCRRNGRVKPV